MKILNTAGAGQSVSADDVTLQSIVVTAAGADANVQVKDGAGSVLASVSAKAGTTAHVSYAQGGRGFSNKRIKGPVTADVTGTGAFVELDF